MCLAQEKSDSNCINPTSREGKEGGGGGYEELLSHKIKWRVVGNWAWMPLHSIFGV